MGDVGEVSKLVARFIDIGEKFAKRKRKNANEATIKTWRQRYEQAVAKNDTEAIDVLLNDIRTDSGFRLPGVQRFYPETPVTAEVVTEA